MKTLITVSVDVQNIAEFRKRNLPISDIINNFMGSYCNLPKKLTKVNHIDINVEIAQAKAQLVLLEKKKIKAEKEAKKKIKKRIVL